MKKFLAALATALLSVTLSAFPSLAATTDFISVWKTDNTSSGSSDANSVALPLVNSGTYDFTVNWGDTVTSEVTAFDDPDATHTYSVPGTYTITISGSFDGFSFSDTGDKLKLIDVSQWGAMKLGNAGNYFAGAANFNSTATDAPDLSGTTTLANAFAGATVFNGAIGNWDVSQVTSLASTFEGAIAFNQELNQWDVSNVTVLRATFGGASAFNRSLANWDVRKVTHFGIAFENARSFNQSLATWNIAAGGVAADEVTQMDNMLSGTAMSSTNYGATLIGWDALTTLVPMVPNQFGTSASYRATTEVMAARNSLIFKGWDIRDSGEIAVVGTEYQKNISYTNNTLLSQTFDSVSVGGPAKKDFVLNSTTCLTTLEPQAACSTSVTWTPSYEGILIDTSVRLHEVGAAANTWKQANIGGVTTGDCESMGFAGGSGTSEDPYLISTTAQYRCINAYKDGGGYLYLYDTNFKLTRNLNFNSDPHEFAELGSWWYGFSSTLDGDGHTLYGIVDDASWASLAPWLTRQAVIKNLVLDAPAFTSEWETGAITAYADTAVTIDNVHVVGGSVTSSVGYSAGGLVAFADHLTLSNSSSSAAVSIIDNWTESTKILGGLVAQANPGTTITKSYSTGSVSYTAGTSSMGAYAGGLVGLFEDAIIEDSYATGAVSISRAAGESSPELATSAPGALIGRVHGGEVRRTYASGLTTGTGAAGHIGLYSAPTLVESSFWDTTTTGQASDGVGSSGGAVGQDTAALKNLQTFADWDIAESPSTEKVWSLSVGSYPVLSVAVLRGLLVPTADPTPTATPTPTPTPTTPVTTSTQPIYGTNPVATVVATPVAPRLNVVALSNAEFKRLGVLQINRMPLNMASRITKTQIVLLNKTQLSAFSPRAIAAIRVPVFAAIKATNLKGLTKTQIKAVTKAQLAALTSAQRRALNR
jgi:hypothetical protein